MSDPKGALLALLQPAPTDEATPPDMYDAPGRCGWHELRVPDWQRAWSFYERLFGWKQGGTVEMGPAGTYQLFGPASLGRDFGGMMDGHTPGWRYYFNVEALDTAIGHVEAGGGSLVHGPTEVPGGSWVVICRDPEGSTFALTAGAR